MRIRDPHAACCPFAGAIVQTARAARQECRARLRSELRRPVYRRRSGSARGDLLRRQRAAGGSDRASDRSRHRPPARTGRDRLLLPFRVGHGVAGRTIDPIDDLLRGPGRSEQPARIERDHTRRGFGGRRKFWSADQEIRAGDRAGAMEFEHGARSLAARSS